MKITTTIHIKDRQSQDVKSDTLSNAAAGVADHLILEIMTKTAQLLGVSNKTLRVSTTVDT